jgi:hypothetical protein
MGQAPPLQRSVGEGRRASKDLEKAIRQGRLTEKAGAPG